MAEVVLKDIRKNYGDLEVVHGVDVNIADGEFLVLVGPSGCGKSTILRMIAGLETITSGNLEIDGAVVNDLEPKDRNIAMVFQNYALYPHMSVYDNMAYGLKVRGRSKEEIRTRVEKAADILGLTDFLERKPRQLSGGQRQRVAMGRAIVRNASVFLLDEPLSNLDAKLRNQMRIELKKLHNKLKNTFIYVTHDQVEAMTLADRIMVLSGGYAEQIGTPDEIYNTPATIFVANFMGSPSMNLLPAELQGDDVVICDTVRLPAGELRKRPDELLAGIRPEHLEQIPESNGNSFEATVDLIEPLGSDTIVHCTTDDGESVVARLSATCGVKEGDVLHLGVTSGHLHLFNAESGNRVNA